MQSIQTGLSFPLAAVKPLAGLLGYRAFCVEATRAAVGSAPPRRQRSPVGEAPLERAGEVEGLEYVRCPETDSLFLAARAPAAACASLLAEVARYRRSPEAFHHGIARSRSDSVYLPKLEWIESTLRVEGVGRPRVMEVATQPSDFTPLLKTSRSIAAAVTVDEMALAGAASPAGGEVDAAVLLESLDRVDDPKALLAAVRRRVVPGGLIFVTALVSSGFDMTVLGFQNRYLYPPDRTNCFSLRGMVRLLEAAGFGLVEVSTPGVLDVEIVAAHAQYDPSLPLSAFERQLLAADRPTWSAFQAFLQEGGLSSFARFVGRNP
jgi:hypothetical protein